MSYLSDSVSGASKYNRSGRWAVGGVGGNDVSGVDNRSVGPSRGSSCCGSDDGKGRELHLDAVVVVEIIK